MLSVKLERSSEAENNSIDVVAGIQGCESVSWNLMWEKDFKNLTAEKRFEYVAGRVQSLAAFAARECKSRWTGTVPTEALRRFFAN